MLYLNEYKSKPDELADLLPWATLVAPGVVRCKDGSLLRSFRYRGPDIDSATQQELVAMSKHVNHALNMLDQDWAIYAEAKRVKAMPYKKSKWPNKIAAAFDQSRSDSFNNLNQLYESEFFLTFQFLPPRETTQRIIDFFIESDDDQVESIGNDFISIFLDNSDKVVNMLEKVFPEIVALNDDQILTYLHSTISTNKVSIKAPSEPIFIDTSLPDQIFCAGLQPKIGEDYIDCISIRYFPSDLVPAMLNQLNELNMEFRCMSRFVYLGKTEATKQIRNSMRRWFANRKSMLASLKEVLFKVESQMTDDDAQDKAIDAKLALSEVKKNVYSFGCYTLTIAVFAENFSLLKDRSKQVRKVINNLGFTTIDNPVNNVEAWLGMVPGNATANVRKPVLSTDNLARLIPTSSTWSGTRLVDHLESDALFQAIGNSSTPFYFSPYVNDVGHTLITGPTGSGKSTLLSFCALSFLRYQNAQVFFFDVKRGSRAITNLMGGKFYELKTDSDGLRLQPLANIDDKEEMSWALEWIDLLLAQEHVIVDAKKKREILIALDRLASMPIEQRTMTGFKLLVQDREIRQVLSFYSGDGVYGAIFDGNNNDVAHSSFISFEMMDLLGSKNAMNPALMCLFHLVERRLDGSPTLIICDEVWMLLEKSVNQIKKWLKTLRSLNAAVFFATQSLDDIQSSEIFPTINDNVLTRIFLPNSKACDANTSSIYRQFGLNDTQIQIIANAVPTQDYYVSSEIGNRLFQLLLNPFQKTMVASSSQMHQKMMDRIEKSGDYFPKAFFDEMGYHDFADTLRKPTCLRKSA